METNLNLILSDIAPIVKVQPCSKYRKWVSNSTKELMKSRDQARMTAKQSGTEVDWNLYRKLRNTVTSQVRKDRKTHYQDKYNQCEQENDISQLYKTVKSQLGWSKNEPPTTLVKPDGTTVTSPKEIAPVQMEYFHLMNEKLMETIGYINIKYLTGGTVSVELRTGQGAHHVLIRCSSGGWVVIFWSGNDLWSGSIFLSGEKGFVSVICLEYICAGVHLDKTDFPPWRQVSLCDPVQVYT